MQQRYCVGASGRELPLHRVGVRLYLRFWLRRPPGPSGESLACPNYVKCVEKKPVLGNSVTHRGKAKYLGGVGTKVTGISRRTFRPNLQRVHVTTPNGTRKTMRVCTQCLRSGAVVKRVQPNPFKLPKTAEAK